MIAMTSRRTLPVLLALAISGCLSPPPSEVPPPDEALREALRELRAARPEAFGAERQAGDEDARRRGDASATAVEAGVRRLALVHPRHVDTLVASAALALEGGNEARAERQLDQALAVDPAHVPALLLRTRLAAESGNLSSARRRLEDALELRPDDVDLCEALAGVLYLQGEHEATLAELDLVDRLDADRAWRSDYHRGLVAEAREDLSTAREHYRRSLVVRSDFEPARRRVRWIDGVLGGR